MRILMANTYHYLRGGDSAYALGISQALRERGEDVVPFAMRSGRNLPSEHEEHFAPELDYPALQAAGGPANAWTVVRNSIYNRQARRSLAGLLDEEPVDLAHLHSVMHHLTASIVLELRSRRVPLVWTLHDAKACCPTTHFLRQGVPCHACAGGRFHNALRYRCKRGSVAASAVVTVELYLHRLWKIYERADLLLAPSRFLRDVLLKTGLRPRRMEVLPNYVDLDRFPASEQAGEHLLYVGRLSPEKGISTLLRAAARHPRLPVVLAGGGELEGPLRRRIDAEGLGHVRLEGHVGQGRLAELLAGARAVALPSECDENCPLAVLEAFASGRAVLGSRRGGIPELVEEGVTGRLVAAGDVDAWSRALEEVEREPASWAEMGRQARLRAETRYGRRAHVDRLQDLYREVLESRGRRACA